MRKKIQIGLFVLINVMAFTNAISQTSYLLIARNTGEKILATNDTIRVFGFATSLSTQPNVPGPIIYGNEGDSVMIDLFNVSQGAPHTIHLHGLDVNQQNDGVGHLSFEVHHMEHGYYRFKAPHPGTYLYHCHVSSPVHVQAGMYGLVIIKPASGADSTWTGGYSFNQDFPLVTSEIDTSWHNNTVLDQAHDTSAALEYTNIPYYAPQFFLVNGLSDQQLVDSVELNSSVGEKNYVRLANLGFYYNRVIFPSGMNAQIIDSDGRPLPAVENEDTVLVFPGERFGVLTEAQSEFTDSIQIQYLDMNTDNIKGQQYVKVTIDGFFGLPERDEEYVLELFPNPGNGIFQIEFYQKDVTSVNLEITDYSGKIILSEFHEMSQGRLSRMISLGPFSSGFYFLKLIDNNGRVYSTKLVMQN